MSKSGLLPIEQSVANHVQNAFPDKDELRLVLGVSGGADSMALLSILRKVGVELHVVHVNYQKRGEASDKDADLVADVASKLNANFEIITVDPEEAGNDNFQQWAREVRYNAFRIKADQVGADGIATAHHEDDQIETVLQKIFRGSGMARWGGMQIWNGELLRPLLKTTREEIEQYCKAFDIPYRTDESNLNSAYARNFLRNEWLPVIQEHFPGWRTNLLRVPEQANIFRKAVHYILNDISDERGRLKRDSFLALDENLRKAVVLQFAGHVDPEQEISRHALKELTKLRDLQTGKSVQLTETLELLRDRDYFKLVINTDDEGFFTRFEESRIEESGFSFNGLVFTEELFDDPDFTENLYIDVERIEWPLTLRQWREGDRFQPFGMEGHQTVADHLTNRKVPASLKSSALVLETFEETICAVIFPPIENRVPPGTISELFRCGSSTRKCLIVKRIT